MKIESSEKPLGVVVQNVAVFISVFNISIHENFNHAYAFLCANGLTCNIL